MSRIASRRLPACQRAAGRVTIHVFSTRVTSRTFSVEKVRSALNEIGCKLVASAGVSLLSETQFIWNDGA